MQTKRSLSQCMAAQRSVYTDEKRNLALPTAENCSARQAGGNERPRPCAP